MRLSLSSFFFVAIWAFGGQESCLGAPVVSNLTAAQRSGTTLVDISYDLSAPGVPELKVKLEISPDGGSTWTVPAITATGDVGEPVSPGSGKAIVWNAGVDWGSQYSTQMRFRVVADDVLTTDFSFIPSGSFQMGRTSGDTDVDAPPITVTVSSFYLSQTETTKALWDEVRVWAVSNGYVDLSAGAGKASDHPVQTVTWWDAVKWCNARSEKERLSPCYKAGAQVLRSGTGLTSVDWSANGYRLPTEAEWERAARGGVAGYRFPHGSDVVIHAQANYSAQGPFWGNLSGSIGFHPDYISGEEPYTSPVGSFPANPYGLSDMSGNVWEWCWDWYEEAYYQTSNGSTNPRGPSAGTLRVRRGGSYFTESYSMRCSNRYHGNPAGKSGLIGFRVARTVID
jgi:formylglycine-generating enzyme required for sulfatase activity